MDQSDLGTGSSSGKKLLANMRRIEWLSQTNVSVALLDSLFVGSFAVFDAFIGDLLSALFTMRSELLNAIEGKISVSDLQLEAQKAEQEMKSAEPKTN
jgi:hypothetical protein